MSLEKRIEDEYEKAYAATTIEHVISFFKLGLDFRLLSLGLELSEECICKILYKAGLISESDLPKYVDVPISLPESETDFVIEDLRNVRLSRSKNNDLKNMFLKEFTIDCSVNDAHKKSFNKGHNEALEGGSDEESKAAIEQAHKEIIEKTYKDGYNEGYDENLRDNVIKLFKHNLDAINIAVYLNLSAQYVHDVLHGERLIE